MLDSFMSIGLYRINKTNLLIGETMCDGQPKKFTIKKPWIACLAENKKNWKERAAQGIYVYLSSTK